MTRRGPDDEGAWSDGCCALGFRRLSVLDLSRASHQPMVTPDGRYVLVFNGEVYNFRELRRELEQEGVVFRSTGDTEVVLQALSSWHVGALTRFNGMFALAFYDARAHKLLLARDPVGIKPLYYLRAGRALAFGSQYDQLLEHPAGRGAGLSSDGLALYLRLGYVPAPYGVLRHTHMLEAGTWLEAGADGSITQGRYYSFPRCALPDLAGREAIEAVDETLGAAVRRQMVSDVALGCFLSGGIDSPLVAAKMAVASPDPIRAFTIGLPGDPSDESADACRYAEQLNVHHVLRHFHADDASRMLDDVVSACGEPLADVSVFPTMMASALAGEQSTVMLSGDGGDELFWGYTARFGSVLAVADAFKASYPVRQGQRLLRRLSGRRNPGPHLVQPSIGAWYRAKHSHRLSEPRLAAVFDDAPAVPADFTLFDYDGHDQDETAHWLRWNEFVGHLSMVLLKVDRASMYHSVEVRVPLLDLDLVALATRIDWTTCLDLRTGLGKQPLRASLARHVSHQTVTKRGFDIPMAQWLRGPFRERMRDLLIGRRELLDLPVRPGRLERLIDDHDTGRVDASASLWSLFSLALWEERYLKGVNAQTGPSSVRNHDQASF